MTMTPIDKEKDSDLQKGATEDDAAGEQNMNSMAGQLGHRDEDPLIKSSDSDFPEPGETPEHTGEPDEPNGKDQDTHYVVGQSDKNAKGRKQG
jgi:hypothetical protein